MDIILVYHVTLPSRTLCWMAWPLTKSIDVFRSKWRSTYMWKNCFAIKFQKIKHCYAIVFTDRLAKELETIRLPVVNKKSPRGISVESFPIIHPHRILAYLFDEVGLEVDIARVREFWTHSREFQEPWAVLSPASDDHIPIGLWGDSARLWTVYRIEKQMSITINLPLFRPRSTRHSRFVVFTIPAEKLFKNRTLNGVWRRLTWSINSCFTGLNPFRGWVANL